MVEEFKPYPYQVDMLKHLEGGAENLVLVTMGLGKTPVVLTYIANVIKEDMAKGKIRRFLVVAPRRVARNVWPREIQKWAHLNHLRLGVCTGAISPHKRRLMLTDPNLDIVAMNYELLTWLCETFAPGQLPFYGLVMDEADKLKNVAAKRFDKFRYRAHEFDVRIAMTGTFTPEGLHNAFGPVYMVTSMPLQPNKLGRKIPMRALLGSSYGAFLRQWFDTNEYTRQHTPRPGAIDGIAKTIKPIVFQARAEDHLDLPELVFKDVYYELPPDARKAYKQLEEDFLLELENTPGALGADEDEDWETREVTAVNAAVVKNKLRQLCSGFLYSYRPPTLEEKADFQARGVEPRMIRETTWLHRAKMDAYRETVGELLGAPHLAVYGYEAELEELGFEYCLSSRISEKDETRILADWDAGRIKTLAMHPASAGHGLNLHEGGAHHIMFLTLPWSRGLLDQTCHRLKRIGQKNTVIVVRFIAKGTVEEDVIQALQAKGDLQDLVVQAIKRRAVA